MSADPRKAPRKTENAVHVPVLVWIRENVSPLVWHCANGGTRHKLEARRFKTLGVMAGVPDLMFIALHGPNKGLTHYVEVKAPDGTLSDEQRAFGRKANDVGAPWACVFSKEEAIEQCRAWGVVKPRLVIPGLERAAG
jgi:hypothetical protein